MRVQWFLPHLRIRFDNKENPFAKNRAWFAFTSKCSVRCLAHLFLNSHKIYTIHIKKKDEWLAYLLISFDER